MIHIINSACPKLTLCSRPSKFVNYLWGRVVVDSFTCKKCVSVFTSKKTYSEEQLGGAFW